MADGLRVRLPQAVALLEEAAEDILAYRHSPEEHRQQLHSNPLERLNKGIKRRSTVVGIFPNVRATLRLVSSNLLEQDDERAVAERRYFSIESRKRLRAPLDGRRGPRAPDGDRVNGGVLAGTLWQSRPRASQEPEGSLRALHGLVRVHAEQEVTNP